MEDGQIVGEEFEEEAGGLLEDTSFVLVNPRYIEEYHYDKVVLQNGRTT